jgi:calnexin
LSPIGSLALELWSIVDGVVFDNFLITSDQSIAKLYANEIWHPKSVLEEKTTPSSTTATPSSSSENVVDAIVNATKERPWLWAVYGLVILVPLMIIFSFCRSSKSTTKKSKDELKKKNDDEEEEVEENEVEQESKERVVVKSKTSGKDALEKESSSSANNKARRRTRKE